MYFWIIVALLILCIGGLLYLVFSPNNTPDVFEVHNVFTPEECNSLIEYSKNQEMTASTVINKPGDEYAVKMSDRNSKTCWIANNENPLIFKLAQVVEMYTGLPLNHQEKAQIVCYDIGGKFNSHYDAQYNSGAAKRKYTCLVYLNDDFEGGETVFDKLGITIKPECGKMVVFKNLDNHDKILETSIHCAKEVRNNNKWICTKWVHSVPTK